jgi:hypothetical protein
MSYHDQLELVLFLLFWFGWCYLAAPSKSKASEPVAQVVQEDIHSVEKVIKPVVPAPVVTYDYVALLPVVKEVQPVAEAVIDYSGMTIRQLKAEAKLRTGTPRAIKGYSRLTKSELIARLSAQ